MVVVMNERATEAQIDSVIQRLIELGMDVHRSSGVSRTVLGVVGAHKIDPELIGILDGVHEVLRISEPYKRASRTFKPEDTVVAIDDVRVGGDEVIVDFTGSSPQVRGPMNATFVVGASARPLPAGKLRTRRDKPSIVSVVKVLVGGEVSGKAPEMSVTSGGFNGGLQLPARVS